jgi:CBS domain-containing protein
MGRIYDLLKDRPLFSADAEDSVLDVARFMVEKNIGAVPVLRDGELVGIFSERDLMKRVVVGARSPGSTKVSEVMTPRPRVVDKDEKIDKCMFIMREYGFRHLPVCDGGKIIGLISLRDLLLRNLTEKDDEVKLMRAYMEGGPANT